MTDPPVGASADLLAAAFVDEAGIRWTCGSDQARQRTWFAATERLLARQPGTRRYLLQRDGQAVAAAWTTSLAGRPPVTSRLGWLIQVLTGCGPAVVARTATYRRREAPLVPPRATILEFVGVLQDARGSGVGGMLLRRVLADTHSGPKAPSVHLSTADPRNVELYRHLGFEVDGTFSLPGLQVTAMSRTPPMRQA
ncbi:GNAT family N-acetyltransferase [Aquipuribacter sp. MA13-6]|uniref:GNAT family N-acetyltransferase n=1 Tax=unclassified Aquipuribacter TaxID=2635084 RepID=UPI003EEEB2D0